MAQVDLFLPSRFDTLERRAANQLSNIVAPVDAALAFFDEVHTEVASAGQGSLVICFGRSGAGKSTFLHTLHLFREGVSTISVTKADDLTAKFGSLQSTSDQLRVLVVEEREALTDASRADLETVLHKINAFVRSDAGANTVVVWPCNTTGMRDQLRTLADEIGAEALLGTREPVFTFEGPPSSAYVQIARQTIATLNQGASLSDLGVSETRADELAAQSNTIGGYLGLLRKELTRNSAAVQKLLVKEQSKLWTVVVAGNDPDNDVAALTRGSTSTADVDRMLTVTQANVVKELKQYPEKLGILGAVLDARIIHLPIIAALAVAREYGDDALKKLMDAEGLSTSRDPKAPEHFAKSELMTAFNNQPVRPRRTDGKPGCNSRDAFKKLASIAAKNDVALNRAVASALAAQGCIQSFVLEKDLGVGLTRRTDIYAETTSGPVRIEMMWRADTGRAEIANYMLTKLYNYGRAIGFLG